MFKLTANFSLQIKHYKRLLLILGAITIAAIFIYPIYNRAPGYKIKAEGEIGGAINIIPKSTELTKIEAPKFYGKDEKEQTYTISARIGTEKTKGLMELEQVWADLRMNDGTYLQLRSDLANIHSSEHRLDLKGDVNIVSDNGYVMNTHSAQVFYKEKSVVGSEPVEVTGQAGIIKAPAFKVLPNMEEIIFHGGRVHTILHSNKENESKQR